MTFDMNDAELPRGTDLIPDGSFVKLRMEIRKGGIDGISPFDRELLKATRTPGSDVRSLECEFTVMAGPHSKRKLWQSFTVAGGKVDEQGVSIGWKISKGMFRAMIDSALGLNPQDMSEATKAKRVLRGLSDLNGITFAAKLRIEPSTGSGYSDSNRLDRVVLPGEPEYPRIMAGEALPPQPSHRATRVATAVSTPPAWGSHAAVPVPAAAPAGRVWERPAATPTPAPTPAPTAEQVPVPVQAPLAGGPSWLNG